MAANQRSRRNVVRETSRPKAFFPILIAIAIAGASILGYVLSRKPAEAEFKPITIDPKTAGPEHGYTLGKADAPVKVLEYADFECPACGHFATVTEPDVRKRIIDTGLASLTFLDFPLVQHRNSQAASNAAACADEQGRFWAKWETCYDSRKYQGRIAANYASGERMKVSQTPSFIIGGKLYPGAAPYDDFKRMVDSAQQKK